MKTKLLKKLRRKYLLSMLFNGKMLLRNKIDVRNDILLEVDKLRKIQFKNQRNAKRIMKKVKKFLNIVAIFTSGMILSSLWLTQTDSWKWYLPVCLTCIVFGQSLSDD